MSTSRQSHVHVRPREVWDALQERGGLQPDGWDADFGRRVALRVSPASGGDIGLALEAPEVDATALVIAVFSAIEPWAEMFGDLARLIGMNDDTSAGEVLRVDFDFGRERPLMSFDPDDFREATQKLDAARALVVAITVDPSWEYATLNAVPQLLASGPTSSDPRVQVWLAEYDRGVAPTDEPPAPVSKHPALDAALAELWKRWLAIHRATVASGVLPMDADGRWAASGWDTPEDERTPALMALLEVDWHWRGRVLAGAYGIAEHPNAGTHSPERLAEAITAALEPLPLPETLDPHAAMEVILALPMWGVRHELYSAWALTQIVDAAAPRPVQLRPAADGSLRFTFNAAHVATISHGVADDVLSLDVWTEARSDLIGDSTVRTKGVQPDWSIVAAGRDPQTEPEASLLELECKQYRKADGAAFAAAITDYARSRRNADIVLADCGPVQEMPVVAKVPKDLQARVKVFGNATPLGSGHRPLRDALAARIDALSPAPALLGIGDCLHVRLDNAPYSARLLLARRDAAGNLEREPVHGTAQLRDGRNRLYLQLDEPERLDRQDVRVLLEAPGIRIPLAPPRRGLRIWHLIDVDQPSGQVNVVNQALQTVPEV